MDNCAYCKRNDVNKTYGVADAHDQKYWVQVGNVIQGDSSISLGLQGIELSGDGNNIILASPSGEGGGTGLIECYELMEEHGATWTLKLKV